MKAYHHLANLKITPDSMTTRELKKIKDNLILSINTALPKDRLVPLAKKDGERALLVATR